MHNILIVEDEFQIAETVINYMVREGYNVQHVTHISEALEVINADTDLIILDLMLPDGEGEDLCEKVVELYKTPVIILSAKRSEQSRINGFACGADDYLTKPFSPRELVARVRSVLKRAKPHDNMIVLDNDMVVYTDRRIVTKNDVDVKLTPNEYKVLLCLINHQEGAVSREQLVRFMNCADVFDRTVDVHVRHLRQKLEDDAKNPEIIKTVHGYGYMLGVKKVP